MAVTVVTQTLMWLGGLADDEDGILALARQLPWLSTRAYDMENGVLIMARQIAALRATAVTAMGRRSGHALRELRLQHRELRLARRERELERIHWELLGTQSDLHLALGEGARYLAQLRAVLLAYHPLHVHIPMAFPGASTIFEGGAIDRVAVENVLDLELHATDIARARLMGHIPR
jgi:hypothetical protein